MDCFDLQQNHHFLFGSERFKFRKTCAAGLLFRSSPDSHRISFFLIRHLSYHTSFSILFSSPLCEELFRVTQSNLNFLESRTFANSIITPLLWLECHSDKKPLQQIPVSCCCWTGGPESLSEEITCFFPASSWLSVSHIHTQVTGFW